MWPIPTPLPKNSPKYASRISYSAEKILFSPDSGAEYEYYDYGTIVTSPRNISRNII